MDLALLRSFFRVVALPSSIQCWEGIAGDRIERPTRGGGPDGARAPGRESSETATEGVPR